MKRTNSLIVLGTLLASVVLVIAVRSLYLWSQRRYWDAKITELCEKEGGLRIFGEEMLADDRFIDRDGNIRISPSIGEPSTSSTLPFAAKATDPYFERSSITILHDRNPRVAKTEVEVVRRSDGKVLGRATSFGRVGGDFIVLDFESRKNCPSQPLEAELVRKIFTINRSQGK